MIPRDFVYVVSFERYSHCIFYGKIRFRVDVAANFVCLVSSLDQLYFSQKGLTRCPIYYE